MSELEAKNKTIWADNKTKTELAGALIDLKIGSDAITLLNKSLMPISWTAIAGTVANGVMAYDNDIGELWKWLRILCRKVPDSSFSTLSEFLSPVFTESNDRIVSKISQLGDAPQGFQIPLADHSSVLNEQRTLDKVKEIIEK